jgi:hypothetical protein
MPQLVRGLWKHANGYWYFSRMRQAVRRTIALETRDEIEATVCSKCHSALKAPVLEAVKTPFMRVVQRPELEETAAAPTPPPPPRRRTDHLIHVARDGEDLGLFTPEQVQRMLTIGQVTLLDHFLDSPTNTWLTLDECPQIAQPNSSL